MTTTILTEGEAMQLLAACKPLVMHLQTSEVGYRLTKAELALLEGYNRVYDATSESQLERLGGQVGVGSREIAWLTVALNLCR